MAKAWEEYACVPPDPAKGQTGTCSVLDKIHHVAHAQTALRILDDNKIIKRLIYDESILNDSRTAVIWLSPNIWYYGSRYGNVQFSFDFAKLAKGRKIYWVEAITKYNPHAVRFILSNDDLSKLPVTPYDPEKDNGPFRFSKGLWYWNSKFAGEFMFDETLYLSECTRVEFILHHHQWCSLGGNCGYLGSDGSAAGSRVIAHILARAMPHIDKQLIDTEPKKKLSTSVDRGLMTLMEGLGIGKGKLDGPLKENDSVDRLLPAALLQYAIDERLAAKETVRLIGSDEIFRKRLAHLVEGHFGLKSFVLDD